MNEFDEIPQAIEIMRGAISELEFAALAGDDPARALETIKEVIFVAASHGKPSPRPGNKFRGVGFTFDEAYIMASLPDHGNSIETAARAYWEGLNEDRIDANLRALYRHKKDLEDVGEGF